MLHLRILAAQMQIKTVQFLETQLFLGQSQVVLTCQRPCSLITLTQGLKAKVSKGPDIQRQYNLYMSCKPHRNLYNNPPLQRVKSLIGQTRIYANHTYITRHNVPPAAALAKVLGINLTWLAWLRDHRMYSNSIVLERRFCHWLLTPRCLLTTRDVTAVRSTVVGWNGGATSGRVKRQTPTSDASKELQHLELLPWGASAHMQYHCSTAKHIIVSALTPTLTIPLQTGLMQNLLLNLCFAASSEFGGSPSSEKHNKKEYFTSRDPHCDKRTTQDNLTNVAEN